jgi:hypothetical protein
MKRAFIHFKKRRVGIFTFSIIVAMLLGFFSVSGAQQTAQKSDTTGGIKQLSFLLGEWIGEGGGANPGQGTGGFSFSMDLQNTVMLRKNYADYPATKDKPSYRHDDLMVIYQTRGDTMRAIYFDNEGHVINYTVDIFKDTKSAVFVSPPSPQGPRFRLTQTLTDDKTMTIKFEMASPGQPDTFSPYITASAHRK